MRKLILDTETTGLDPEKDRIIELACIELIDDIPSGVKFHQYYNSDGIIISHEAELIHGINNKFLSLCKKLLAPNLVINGSTNNETSLKFSLIFFLNI